ncbi:predicted exonuclease of the beta-lactamase fold [Anaerolinea thermolimosa]|uniref:MBL fold metallo-hydrolase RNA specificity domain-containing protein n=1 Tax=Anaerolinea thermolimosa TaxID=229919 RepID=UPI000780BB45|nr:MBL fold metallo-hydrolase [Anaerolinea thermolimosa]GAP07852.1 predicted exonuclease of the beta-lactamase fold [Anaerolinea thermolimosa]
MKIHFDGAAQTVTGSQHLLEVNGRRLLLECGMFQGRRADTYTINRNFPFSPAGVDAVILSHAHIDHSGNLPNLVKQGFRGPIYATPATADLADVMLRDSGHIQEADAEYINRKNALKGKPPVEPLYTIADAEAVGEFFRPVRYLEAFEPVAGVTARFFDAGHILGSAGVCLDVRENGRLTRLWFSGDIGRDNLPLLKDPTLPEAAEVLIMECTYGDKPHRDPEAAYTEFRDVVLRTVERGGKVIIPAFSVGRTQEIVYSLNRMISEGNLPALPVYVDSPLALNATEVFIRHADLFDEETRQFIREVRHPALEFKGLVYTRSVEESKAINDRPGPMVIISASGMAETGRILHHLKNNIEDPRNTVMIVSWQAPDTLGRRLAERQKKVRIFGEEYSLRCEVATIGGLSAHAGQDMLLRYALSSRKTLRKTFLVHGEPPAAGAFMEKLAEAEIKPVFYPQRGEVVEI